MKNNLDAALNELGYSIVDDIKNGDDEDIKKNLKNFIEKALGVLVNDGVYAYYVYCLAKNDGKNKIKNIFIEKVIDTIKPYLKNSQEDSNNIPENFFINLSNNLYDLLSFRSYLERSLIYARYHAKAGELK